MLTPEIAVDLVAESLHMVMLLVTLLAVILMGRWMSGYLMDYCVSIFTRAATLVG